jgi:hypothetical protein
MTDVRLTGHLTDTLANIARWYPPTADPPRTLQSQTRTAYGSRPPIAAAVLSLRSETVNTLTSWAQLVCEEQDLHPTTPCARPRRPPVIPFVAATWPWVCGCGRERGAVLLDGRRHQLGQDVAALTSFLAAHAEWFAAFDGDYAAHELGHLAYRLEQVVRQTTPARVRHIAPCPERDCGGTLEAVVRTEDDLLPSHVYCSADRAHTWAPEEWRALRRRLEALLDVAG